MTHLVPIGSHTHAAIYSVETASAVVHMSAVFNKRYNDCHAVVIVDAGKFLSYCRNILEPAPWNVSKRERVNKYFARGGSDPVPLAIVDTSDIQDNRLRLSDGSTRMRWLLDHGAVAFPVQCNAADAEALHKLAGVDGMLPRSVKDLLGNR